jgi:transposase-like protein
MRKIQRHTQAEMFAHVEACRKGNQPKKIYCQQKGLAYSTLHYWAKKYREELSEQDAQKSTSGFIPLKVEVEPDP